MPVVGPVIQTPPAVAVTTADLIRDARELLLSGHQEELDQLKGDLASGEDTVVLRRARKGVQEGAVLAVDLEEMYVWGRDNGTAEVLRGHNGSTPSPHAANALIRINPKASDFRIVREMNNELRGLSSPSTGLYRMRSVQVTFDAAKRGYDLVGVEGLVGVHEVRIGLGDDSGDLPRLRRWEYVGDPSKSTFESGHGLRVFSTGIDGEPLTVYYRGDYGLLSETDDRVDVVEVTGLPPSALQLLPVGAVLRITAPWEIRRNFLDEHGDSRLAEEIPPGAVALSPRELRRTRESLIKAELTRLQQLYPDRRAGV